jgi:quercetin dioxygenase-like cupin family protein
MKTLNCSKTVTLIASWSAALGCFMGAGAMAAGAGTDPAQVASLMQRALIGAPGKEVQMLTVAYMPGGASLPHRHDAQVFVYVLQGTLEMQVQGQPRMTLHAGDTFYESPTDVHVVSANASRSEPAKILVFIVKNTGAPVSLPAAPQP